MSLKELSNLRINYEKTQWDFFEKTQSFFLKRGFSPYVWIDDRNYLHIKIKTRRGNVFFDAHQDKIKFSRCVKTFSEIENLEILYKNQNSTTDYSLNEEINTVWDIEVILRGV